MVARGALGQEVPASMLAGMPGSLGSELHNPGGGQGPSPATAATASPAIRLALALVHLGGAVAGHDEPSPWA